MKTYKYTPLSEIVLRKYEKPENLDRRELVKRICLSLGLLQPGDSRDVVVDILYVLLEAGRKKEFLESEQIKEQVEKVRQDHKCDMLGIAQSNIRRQIRRLRELFIVEKIKNTYRITEFLPLSVILEEKIIKYLLPSTLSRIKEHLNELD